MPFKIRDTDHGFRDLKRLIQGLVKGQARVDVGITSKAGAKSHSKNASVADIATFHEFGIGVPIRSWLRGWFDERRAWIKTQVVAAERAVVEGRLTEDQALELLGQKLVGDIKERIQDGGAFEDNADSTIAKKGSDKPLIDEGRFIGSISHEVHSR